MMQAQDEQRHKILIVDDDPDIRAEMEEYLVGHGFAIGTADNGTAMRQMMERVDYDLIIMDLSLPGEDGLSLTKFIQSNSQIPVIMVTGRVETIDRVLGLELGADDYINKPFDLRELLARIGAVLRRTKAPARQESQDDRTIAEFEGWRFDLQSRVLTSPDDKDIDLTTAEFKLLEAFVSRANRVMDRDSLLDIIHGRDWSPYDRSIDNLVVRLRRKIEADPKHPKMIKSVRGAGYIFAANVKHGS